MLSTVSLHLKDIFMFSILIFYTRSDFVIINSIMNLGHMH